MKPKRPMQRKRGRAAAGASGVDPRVYARALKLRAELAGGSYAAGADANLDPALVPVRELLTEWMWGRIWTRKGIDRRTRSFMNIGILIALNRPQELTVNLRMAVENGLSRAEIGEAILHAAGYCGTPAGVNSIGVANRFFEEQGKVPGKRGRPGAAAGARRSARRPKNSA